MNKLNQKHNWLKREILKETKKKVSVLKSTQKWALKDIIIKYWLEFLYKTYILKDFEKFSIIFQIKLKVVLTLLIKNIFKYPFFRTLSVNKLTTTVNIKLYLKQIGF